MQNAAVIAPTIVDLARLALYAYAIQRASAFLIHWLDSRNGQPLFNTARAATREQALDIARKAGITVSEDEPVQ